MVYLFLAPGFEESEAVVPADPGPTTLRSRPI